MKTSTIVLGTSTNCNTYTEIALAVFYKYCYNIQKKYKPLRCCGSSPRIDNALNRISCGDQQVFEKKGKVEKGPPKKNNTHI